MTRRISKTTGRAYTEGSQSGFGLFPHDCFGCGERIVLARPGAVWFENVKGELRSWHWECRPGTPSDGAQAVATEPKKPPGRVAA